MSGKRHSVSYLGLVEDVVLMKVVKSGVVRDIPRALVVCEGVAREYWPTTDTRTHALAFTSDPETSRDTQTAPIVPQAAAEFVIADGRYYLDNTPPGTLITEFYVTPPVNATEQFLIRWNTVSGTLQSDGGFPENTWVDMFDFGSAKIFSVFIEQASTGVNNAVADIDIADDTGGGVPGTAVTKRITFIAERISDGTDAVIMTTAPWDLEHITVDDVASCRITMDPFTNLVGREGPLVAFNENYVGPDQPPSAYTAQLDLVSGDAPTSGPALATPIDLDVLVEWELAASVDAEDFTGEYDLTITGPANAVTKRITMHSARSDTPAVGTVVLPTTPVLFVSNPPDLSDTDTTLTLFSNGTTVATGDWDGIQDSADWHSAAPVTTDGLAFEVFLELLGGSVPGVGAVGVWQTLQIDRVFMWNSGTGVYLESFFNIHVRQVGVASTEVTRGYITQHNTSQGP